MMSSEKPLLPSLAAILCNDKPKSEPCSPSLETLKNRFCSDDHGIIRLPPLNGTITRPKSVDSALRHTCSMPTLPTVSMVESSKIRAHSLAETDLAPVAKGSSDVSPSTPIVRKKSNSTKKVDMLTPLSAARAMITPSANDKKRAFAFITHSQETFPTKEPKIDNAPLARRKRRRTSTQELNILQAEFNLCAAPDKCKRQQLADRCHMSEKAIQIWFQNKRQASKKQRNSLQKAVEANETASHGLDIPKTTHTVETMTPVASRTMKPVDTTETPRLVIPVSDSSVMNTGDITPTRASSSSNGKRGQALTFHLTSDKKVLTPIKTSPNNRVNKLINGPGIVSPYNRKPRSPANSPTSKVGMDLTPTKKHPLKELNTNTLVH